jgi:hypothetical protein
VLLILYSAAILLANGWRRVPLWLLATATAAGVAGMRFLIAGPSPGVHTLVAVVCGSLLGALSAGLTHIALRARRLKALD